jgi:hypothetical protein
LPLLKHLGRKSGTLCAHKFFFPTFTLYERQVLKFNFSPEDDTQYYKYYALNETVLTFLIHHRYTRMGSWAVYVCLFNQTTVTMQTTEREPNKIKMLYHYFRCRPQFYPFTIDRLTPDGFKLSVSWEWETRCCNIHTSCFSNLPSISIELECLLSSASSVRMDVSLLRLRAVKQRVMYSASYKQWRNITTSTKMSLFATDIL